MALVINGTTGITNPGTEQVATTIGVGNATPANTGAGITFPATQSASTDANTLDDYEEGTWTPTVSSAISGSLTSYTSYGIYTKIGNTVIAKAAIKITNVGTAATGLLLSGYPFTSNNLSAPSDSFVAFYRENAVTGNTGGSTLGKNGTTGAMIAALANDYVFEWTMVYQTS